MPITSASVSCLRLLGRKNTADSGPLGMGSPKPLQGRQSDDKECAQDGRGEWPGCCWQQASHNPCGVRTGSYGRVHTRVCSSFESSARQQLKCAPYATTSRADACSSALQHFLARQQATACSVHQAPAAELPCQPQRQEPSQGGRCTLTSRPPCASAPAPPSA